MELNNLTELELYFADHFDTVLFSVLAEIYQSKGEYDRAKKVCEIGLKHHPDSTEAKFILAQAEMGLGNLHVAEQWMKKVIEKYPNHKSAVAALQMLQEQLGRSKNTLSASWGRAQDVDPNNQFAKDFLSPKSSKKRKAKKPTPTNVILDEVSVSPRLATFTLVHVLKEQELFNRALDVLDILEEKGENKERIKSERAAIMAEL